MNQDTPTKTGGRRRYPSDLTDEQWRRVARMIDPKGTDAKETNEESGNADVGASSVGRGRPRIVDMREVVNAMNYRWRTGCTWRMLPHDFPAWATVYAYFRQWRRDGRLPEVRALLLERETVLERIASENAA